MIEAIHEKIEVVLIFRLNPGPITQIYQIKWRGKKYTIGTQAYHHKVWDGRTRCHKFAVSAGNLDFRLSYDTENLQWLLEEVSDGIAN
jgi:hypothetical protein